MLRQRLRDLVELEVALSDGEDEVKGFVIAHDDPEAVESDAGDGQIEREAFVPNEERMIARDGRRRERPFEGLRERTPRPSLREPQGTYSFLRERLFLRERSG